MNQRNHEQGGDVMDPERAFPNEGRAHGMTLRDYFAARAMQAKISHAGLPGLYALLAKDAYEIADAMLAAREA